MVTDAALVMDASRATTTQFVVLTARDEKTAPKLEAMLNLSDLSVEQYVTMSARYPH